MARPGPLNLVTDVDGILVGNAEDRTLGTGTTVVIAERPATAGVDVRGGAPGTRETDALSPTCLVERVDAIVLSGGSAFGLDAASGAMAWLVERGRGFAIGKVRVPIVPAAILFDLRGTNDGRWPDGPPYRALGHAAAAAAAREFAQGNAGAGLGATAGDLKGGLGSVSIVTDEGLAVGAIVAANPLGGVVMPGSATLWAWALEQGDELGRQPPPRAPIPAEPRTRPGSVGGHTTLGVVATNAILSPAQSQRVAIMAQDGIARAVRPAHTPFDGDTIFALATGTWAGSAGPDEVARIGSLAADCVARAIARGVYRAEDAGDYVSYRSRHGASLRGPSG